MKIKISKGKEREFTFAYMPAIQYNSKIKRLKCNGHSISRIIQLAFDVLYVYYKPFCHFYERTVCACVFHALHLGLFVYVNTILHMFSTSFSHRFSSSLVFNAAFTNCFQFYLPWLLLLFGFALWSSSFVISGFLIDLL